MNNTSLVNMRRIPSPSELEGWIVRAISDRLAQRQEFTAYDITLQLRAAHIDVEIDHDYVRQYVVDQAGALGLYVGQETFQNGQTARVYYGNWPFVPGLNAPTPSLTATPTPQISGPPTTPLYPTHGPTNDEPDLLPGIKPL